MAKTAAPPRQLKKGAKVLNRVELRDVPEGTAGKVELVAGLTWIRYWVRFDNGIWLGSLDRDVLATPEEWKRVLSGEEEAVAVGSDGADGAAAEADDGGTDEGGGATTPSGTFIPQKFLDRAKAARERLAA